VAVLYGLATAAFYATYLVCGKGVMSKTPPVAATLVILSTAALAYGGAAPFVGLDAPSSTAAWIGIVGLAIVATVVAIGLLLWGLAKVSAVEAASLSALEPLVSAVIAVAVLGQPLRAWHVFGGVLVIVAVLVLARHAGEIEQNSTV
jgi:drug/metabolite transporter (DMT)-like permease